MLETNLKWFRRTKSDNFESKVLNFFELLLHEINFFGEKTGSIWTVPSDFLGKKM